MTKREIEGKRKEVERRVQTALRRFASEKLAGPAIRQALQSLFSNGTTIEGPSMVFDPFSRSAALFVYADDGSRVLMGGDIELQPVQLAS